MKFRLEFSVPEEAFTSWQDGAIDQLYRVAGTIAQYGEKSGKVRDINGNNIGSFELVSDGE